MDYEEIRVPSKDKPSKTDDLEVVLLLRSSKEALGTLKHLSDHLVRCVLSQFELVLVEKEEKVLMQYQKTLRSLKIVLQDRKSVV